MQVREVLKAKGRRLVHIGPEARVSDAIHRLVEHDIGSLPVLNEKGRLIGIFTERDVLRGVDSSCEDFARATIANVMTTNPITCDLDDNVHEVMRKMSERRVGQLPVVDENQNVVGVVSVGDVIKLLYEKIEAENRHLLEYLYGPG